VTPLIEPDTSQATHGDGRGGHLAAIDPRERHRRGGALGVSGHRVPHPELAAFPLPAAFPAPALAACQPPRAPALT
jgi:hypothetical protein